MSMNDIFVKVYANKGTKPLYFNDKKFYRIYIRPSKNGIQAPSKCLYIDRNGKYYDGLYMSDEVNYLINVVDHKPTILSTELVSIPALEFLAKTLLQFIGYNNDEFNIKIFPKCYRQYFKSQISISENIYKESIKIMLNDKPIVNIINWQLPYNLIYEGVRELFEIQKQIDGQTYYGQSPNANHLLSYISTPSNALSNNYSKDLKKIKSIQLEPFHSNMFTEFDLTDSLRKKLNNSIMDFGRYCVELK